MQISCKNKWLQIDFWEVHYYLAQDYLKYLYKMSIEINVGPKQRK